MAMLMIVSSNGAVRSVPIDRPVMSVGSASSNDIVIDDGQTEETHLLIQFDGQSFSTQTSARSIWIHINGKKKRRSVLREGDEIRLGDTTLRFYALWKATAPADDAQGPQIELHGLHKIQRLSERLLTDYEIGTILETLMDDVIELLHANRGFLILCEDDRLCVKVGRNINQENIARALEKVSDSIIDRVVNTREPVIVSDAINDNDFNASQSVIDLQLSSVVCAPLLDRGNLIGLIYLGNDRVTHLFTNKHLDLLTLFTAHASLIVAHAILLNELRLDNAVLQETLINRRFGSIIGSCSAMREVFRAVEKVAPTNVNVLILGETGTGKELIAHEIHARSAKATGPFVTINCGAIPETLLESELFGHVKGAFTGATSDRLGKFQAADGGTLFLDEIGEMPSNLQVKLLRALQEHTVTKVGALHPEHVDIRVIAATNRNLEKAVDDGSFRGDLYYRLNVVTVELPPLREREDDITVIAKFLVQKISTELATPSKEFRQDTLQAMRRFGWPGNIRQLENRLKRALVLSTGSMLTVEDLGLDESAGENFTSLAEAKDAFAHKYIMKALERNDGNRSKTARELDVDPRTIFRYLEK
jgi:transcriptional regulator with GAF, ATPase, and Fis domain